MPALPRRESGDESQMMRQLEANETFPDPYSTEPLVVDWMPRSLVRRLCVMDPGQASERLIDLQDENKRLREAARNVISVFMADAMLDDPDGKWDAAINELEAAAGLGQQEGS